VVNGFGATIPAAEVERLAADPRVRAVVPDRAVRARRSDRAGTANPGAAAAPPPICPTDPARPSLEPEALALTRATHAQGLATGKGVKVGFVAGGLEVDNPDLLRADLSETSGTIATIVQGIDHAVTVARVDVLNESLGNNPIPDRHNDPIPLANHTAVAAGITVVAASGDAPPHPTDHRLAASPDGRPCRRLDCVR